MHTEKRAGLCKSVAVPVSPSLYRRKEFGSKRHFVMPTVLPGPLPCTICLTAFSQAQPLPQASSRTKAVRRVGGCSAPRWQMQCAALADAVRRVDGCSAVRWRMQRGALARVREEPGSRAAAPPCRKGITRAETPAGNRSQTRPERMLPHPPRRWEKDTQIPKGVKRPGKAAGL